MVVLLTNEPVATADKSWAIIEPKTLFVTGFILTKSGRMKSNSVSNKKVGSKVEVLYKIAALGHVVQNSSFPIPENIREESSSSIFCLCVKM